MPADRQVEIAGKIIPDGLLYVGRGLRAPSGGIEPALIDPDLALDRRDPDHEGVDLPPRPAYAALSPASRAGYLTWLADGRRRRRAPVGYVLLHLSGLERRVLVDGLQHDLVDDDEYDAITAELRRLRDLYDTSVLLREGTDALLGMLSVIRPGADVPPPPHAAEHRWPVPPILRAGLGRFAARGRPVPADWALSWTWYHPAFTPDPLQSRCPAEFARLFAIRYREHHGDGLLVAPGRPPVHLHHRPVNSGLPTTGVDLPGVPDVLEDAEATRALSTLVDGVTAELEAFGRYVERRPAERGSLAATALLPAALADDADGPAAPLLAWAAERLGSDASVVIDGADLVAFWPTRVMSRADVVACAQLMERHGIGLEPDPRLGGPVVGDGPAVLFEARGDVPRAAGPEYVAASTLLQLAVAVGGVDGAVQAVEQEVMLEHLASSLDLTDAERERLMAHLHWLSAIGPRLGGLADRVAALPADRREAVGDVLVAVAAADGVVDPTEVDVLQRIFGMLGLTVESLYQRLHADLVGAPPVDPAAPAAPGAVRLDPAVLAAAAAGTSAVAALLGDIFAEDDPDPDPDDAAAGLDAAGLDAAHRALLVEVLTRPRWTGAAFAELADRAGLMPLGALDTLNEHAVDLCDDVLIETEDDDLVLNDFAVEAITR